MTDGKFAPSRLALARQRQGLSIIQLADRINLTPQSISNIERGRQRPSACTITKLSKALEFPEQFFAAGEMEELEERQLSFRARTKTSSRAKSAVRGSARLAVELKAWVDERFVTPAVDLPTVEETMPPDLAAEHVRARWGINPTQSVSNCIHLLESRGVAIFSVPTGYDDVDAFSFWWRGHPFIMLSTTKSAERSRFDTAHELGHLVMHRNRDYERDLRAAEREANMFASAFLMPRRSVLEKMPRPITTDRILRAKGRWRVAAMALAYRLHELGLLTEWTFRQTVIDLGRLGYRTDEPDGIERENSQLLAKVFGALRSEGLSLSAVARELHLNTDILRDITFGWMTQTEAVGEADEATRRPRDRTHLRLVR